MSFLLQVLAVVLNAGEGALSYLSRLAARNGPSCVRHFCVDVGLDFQGIVECRPEELTRLSDISGLPVQDLDAWSMRPDAEGLSLRGQRLVRNSVHRISVRACPACLLDDIAKSDCSPDVSAYGRTVWQLASVRTCPIHGLALVELGRDKRSGWYDFSAVVRTRVKDLVGLAESAPRRPCSSLEEYVVERLENAASMTVPFLDSMPLHAAARTCEVVGAIALHGPKLEFRLLGDDDWHTAGAVGFDTAVAGEPGIREMLTELQRSYVRGTSGNTGPHAPFGTLYAWLNVAGPKAAYAPLRDLVRRHVGETTPVGPGDECLGEPLTRRVLHSVRSASLESGLHPKRLRKVIAMANFLPTDHGTLKDNEATFDAAAAAPLLARLATAVPLVQVGEYLGCGRVQARLLLTHGIIRPLVDAKTTDGWHAFARADLDDFLARLLADGVPAEDDCEATRDIPSAARRLHCSAVEIVHLILGRKLAWVGRSLRRTGYMSVLVRPEEVRPWVRGQELNGLTLLEARTELRTSDPVIRSLIEVGALSTTKGISPFSRVPVIVITQASMDGFRSEFVSLTELAGLLNTHTYVVKRELTRNGVSQAVATEHIGATYYKRAEVLEHFPEMKCDTRTCRKRPR